MTAFFQAVAGVLIAVVLCTVVSRQGKDISVLLSLLVCCMVLIAALHYLEPVLELVHTLQEVSQIDESLLTVILKAVGIGMIAQIAALICSDSGNGALGKAVEILAALAVLWLAIPMMKELLELIQQMTGEL